MLLNLAADRPRVAGDEHPAQLILREGAGEAGEGLVKLALSFGGRGCQAEHAEARLDDRRGVAPKIAAVLLQDRQLAADRLQRVEDVAGIGVLRRQLERAPLATAADQDLRAA